MVGASVSSFSISKVEMPDIDIAPLHLCIYVWYWKLIFIFN